MSQIHSPECYGTDNFNAVFRPLSKFETFRGAHRNAAVLLSRNTCFQTGVVADDVSVNATSAPKPVTECHFFVKSVVGV
jgi:hypothetical protein